MNFVEFLGYLGIAVAVVLFILTALGVIDWKS